MKLTPTVCIFESLNFKEEESFKEGEIISRTLRLSGIKTKYVYMRTRDELEQFVKAFGRSAHAYLHLSCHGNKGNFGLTLDSVSSYELSEILAPQLDDRRLFVSACLATDQHFAARLLAQSKCISIVGPVGEINFDDAAIFWSSFYHLMFKANIDGMSNSEIQRNLQKCASLVNEKFNLFTIEEGRTQVTLIDPKGREEGKPIPIDL
jgi:hypothetical protein